MSVQETSQQLWGGETTKAVANFTDDPKHTGYGALAFRPEDTDLREAVDKELHAWLGTPDHPPHSMVPLSPLK